MNLLTAIKAFQKTFFSVGKKTVAGQAFSPEIASKMPVDEFRYDLQNSRLA